jgi:hypothetical protein
MTPWKVRTIPIGLATLGLIRSRANPARSFQSALADTIIVGIIFCGAITIIGNTRSRGLSLARIALLVAIAMTSFRADDRVAGLEPGAEVMTLKTHHVMKIIAVAAVGLALAELEGAYIAFGVCAFVVLILFICYH